MPPERPCPQRIRRDPGVPPALPGQPSDHCVHRLPDGSAGTCVLIRDIITRTMWGEAEAEPRNAYASATGRSLVTEVSTVLVLLTLRFYPYLCHA
jgi:hypothetical protein